MHHEQTQSTFLQFYNFYFLFKPNMIFLNFNQGQCKSKKFWIETADEDRLWRLCIAVKLIQKIFLQFVKNNIHV